MDCSRLDVNDLFKKKLKRKLFLCGGGAGGRTGSGNLREEGAGSRKRGGGKQNSQGGRKQEIGKNYRALHNGLK